MKTDIEIKNLSVDFMLKKDKISVLHDVSIKFYHDQITGLVGESGSGKSVLGMAILGLLPKYAQIRGECNYCNHNILNISESQLRKIRGSEIGFIAQNSNLALNPTKKIIDQLCEGLIIQKKYSKEDSILKNKKLLKNFGFSEPEKIMQRYAFQMSGGMNQRGFTFMGLNCQPSWIIADEPTKGLDAILARDAYLLLNLIKEKWNSSMIVITHDLRRARFLCDRIAIMYKGEILEEGKSRDILDNPNHPYTIALLNSLPENGMKPLKKFRSVKEMKCGFFNYCPDAETRCQKQRANMYNISDSRKVKCWKYAKN